MQKKFVIVRRESAKREPCKQTMIEQEDLNRRIRRNQASIPQISYFMDRFFGGNLRLKEATALASNLAKHIGLKLDRVAKRHKPAMICWFCENWNCLFPYLLKMKGIKLPPNFQLPVVQQQPPPKQEETPAPQVIQPQQNEVFEFDFTQGMDDWMFKA